MFDGSFLAIAFFFGFLALSNLFHLKIHRFGKQYRKISYIAIQSKIYPIIENKMLSPLYFGVIFGIEKSVYLILTNNKLSPDGDHSNSELRALSTVAQSPKITWGNLSPPVSAGVSPSSSTQALPRSPF